MSVLRRFQQRWCGMCECHTSVTNTGPQLIIYQNGSAVFVCMNLVYIVCKIKSHTIVHDDISQVFDVWEAIPVFTDLGRKGN